MKDEKITDNNQDNSSTNQVSEQNIRLAMEAIDEEEYIQVLQNLMQRKWDSLKGTNILQKKQKIVAYLVQKGFETDLILEEIKQRYI
jgi:regulatory protein